MISNRKNTNNKIRFNLKDSNLPCVVRGFEAIGTGVVINLPNGTGVEMGLLVVANVVPATSCPACVTTN